MTNVENPLHLGYKFELASYGRSEVLTERDIPSLGVRTGGWVEVDVSVAAVAVAVAPLTVNMPR